MPLAYKYRSVAGADQLQRIQSILSTGQFWFANATEVNDPFEFRCAVSFTWDVEKTAEAFALVEMHQNPGCSYSDALLKARTVLGRVARSRLQERQWELSYNMWKTWADITTMCCLAGTGTSLLMWSHYGGNHTGVAIEVEIPEDQLTDSPARLVHKIEYSDELPRINPLSLVDMSVGMKERLFEALFFRKSKCWEYEQEYRILRADLRPCPFVPSHQAPLPKHCLIKRLILGCAMSSETREQLQSLVSTQAPHVRIAYAMPSTEGTYELSIVEAGDVDA